MRVSADTGLTPRVLKLATYDGECQSNGPVAFPRKKEAGFTSIKSLGRSHSQSRLSGDQTNLSALWNL